MGCPPDPAEIDFLKTMERLKKLQSKVAFLVAEYNNALIIYNNHLDKTGEKKELLSVPKIDEEITEMPSEFSPYADLLQAGRKEDIATSIVKNIETRLCDLRTLILNSVNQNKIPDSFLIDLKQAHLLHRLEDKKNWLAWLGEQADFCNYVITQKQDFEEDEIKRAYALKEKIEIEKARVKAFSNKEILSDNFLFGRSPDEFDKNQIYLI